MARRSLHPGPWGLRGKIALLAIAELAAALVILDGLLIADAASDGSWLGASTGGSAKTLVFLSLLILSAGAVVAVLAAGWIEGPLKAVLGRLRLAVEADAQAAEASARIIRESLDGLSDRFRSLHDFLSKMKAELAEGGESLQPSSEKLLALHGSLVSGATLQSKQAAEMRAQAETLTTTLNTVILNADDTLKVAHLAVESAKKGGEVVNQTVKHMNAITITVTNSAKIIRELGERSKGIGEIIRVIDDIADQTNLLALNAAIEAARAGDQGRGFAVVADEVRKLAERTTIATKEIAAMIRSIQAETNSAVKAMDAGIQEVDKGAGLAVQAGVWLQKIVGGARKVADKISIIAKSSETQSSTAESMSGDIGRLAKSAQENLARVMEAREAAEVLLEAAGRFAGIAKAPPLVEETGASPASTRAADEASRIRSRNQELLRRFDIELDAG